MKFTRLLALALIALLVVGAMGAVAYRTLAQTPPPDTEASEGGEANEENGAALQGQAALTQEEAEAIALAEYPGATVVSTELENEGGTLLYSVELDNGAEVELDANTGTILAGEAETGGESDG